MSSPVAPPLLPNKPPLVLPPFPLLLPYTSVIQEPKVMLDIFRACSYEILALPEEKAYLVAVRYRKDGSISYKTELS